MQKIKVAITALLEFSATYYSTSRALLYAYFPDCSCQEPHLTTINKKCVLRPNGTLFFGARAYY